MGPVGTVLGEYMKHNAIPGVEMVETGSGPVPVVETPYGKISFLICFDMDHHEFPLEMAGTRALLKRFDMAKNALSYVNIFRELSSKR